MSALFVYSKLCLSFIVWPFFNHEVCHCTCLHALFFSLIFRLFKLSPSFTSARYPSLMFWEGAYDLTCGYVQLPIHPCSLPFLLCFAFCPTSIPSLFICYVIRPMLSSFIVTNEKKVKRKSTARAPNLSLIFISSAPLDKSTLRGRNSSLRDQANKKRK